MSKTASNKECLKTFKLNNFQTTTKIGGIFYKLLIVFMESENMEGLSTVTEHTYHN